MLVNAADMLKKAEAGKYALGAFNTNNLEWTLAILQAAEEAKSPLILQCTAGAAKWMGGFKVCADMVKAAVEATGVTVPVALHLDHGSYEDCFKCIEAGFTSIMYDGSHEETFQLNLDRTKELVELAHSKGMSIEAEVGGIGGTEDGVTSNGELAAPAEGQQRADLGVGFLACGLGDGVPACARRGDEEARVGVPEDVGGGARGVDGVKGRGHEAAAQGRLVERDGVDAVGEQPRDALALDKAHVREGAAPAQHLFVERPPGDGVPAALRIVVLAERLAFGPGGDRVTEHVRNGEEVVDKASGVRHVSLSSERCLVAAALECRGSADQFSSKMACGCE